jgi:hypothetical protein
LVLVIFATSGETAGDAEAARPLDDHLVPLPGTDWTVWRDAVLRATGFPAAGLGWFSDPGFAAAADAYLDGSMDLEELTAVHAEAMERARRVSAELKAHPLFREAVTWQNPALAGHLPRAGVTSREEGNGRWRRKQWNRDDTFARYWQRYCGKNDTIGFFGPVSWVTLDPDGPPLGVHCGPGLLRSRHAQLEFWAVKAFADHVAADPVVRPWLPVGRHPHVLLDGRRVLRAGDDPLELTATEAALFARCDGTRTAAEIVADPAVDGGGEEKTALLEGLVERGVLWWGADLPQTPQADQVLESVLTAIADDEARDRALSGFRRLEAALAGVSAAAGDADRLMDAVDVLEAEFAAVTGEAISRRPGSMYAGRRLFYEDTVRDLDLSFGKPLLEALAGPFGRILLPAARWLSTAVAEAYSAAFRTLYDKLLEPGTDGVPLDRFWVAAQSLFEGDGLPADEAAQEFVRRWTTLFDADSLEPGTRRVTASSAELADRAAELFPAPRPGWATARIHSPDLHICAPSAEAVARGEFTVVLGEMHAMWPTLDCAVFVDRHPEPERLYTAFLRDIGTRISPAYQDWCAHFTPRIATVLAETDEQLAFSAAAGIDRSRLLPVMALTVVERDGELVVTGAGGRVFPLFAVFDVPIAFLAAEILEPGIVPRQDQPQKVTHSPRMTIDRLVAARETWRTTVGTSGLTVRSGRLAEYLAARRLRRDLGLPERVFIKIKTETKPVFVDLTSPRYVSSLCTMLRSVSDRHGEDVQIVITEMLPDVDQAWLPDADGQLYFSELRIQLRDPMAAG